MATKIKEKRNAFTPLTVILLIALILYALSLFYLLAWAVSTSFKVNSDIFHMDPGGLLPNYDSYFKYFNDQVAEWTVKLKNASTFAEINEAETMLTGAKRKLAALTKAKEEMHGLIPFHTYVNMFKGFTIKTAAVFGQPAGEIGMAKMYLNSILYATGCAFAATFVPCIAAYACARFKFKFSRIMHTTVIIVMMIPIVGSMPSEIEVAKTLGFMNQIWGLWLMKANFLGLYFLMFYDVCKALPASFSEAAKIDGANNFQIFFKIAMPLLKNTFMTVLLILFISFWNDYQTPMVYMPSFPVIAVGLNTVMTTNAYAGRYDHTMVPARMAIAVMTAVPVIILFACFQKRLLGNLTVGGVKG
ncbi:MAG: carbohydrate ABC transporter permease [Clostridia bacterium]|nr:carbohydrate ABC transporter permease [Clostridia bacterium]